MGAIGLCTGAGGLGVRKFRPSAIPGCTLHFDFADASSIATEKGYLINCDNLLAANWTAPGGAITVTPNAGIAPDGTNTAFSFTANTVTSNLTSAITNVNWGGTMPPMTLSVFAKYSNARWLVIQSRNAPAYRTSFDIQNGVLGTAGVYHQSASIVSYGNGWFKCTTTVTADAGVPSLALLLSSTDGNPTQTVGDACLLWNPEANQPRAASIVNKASGVVWNPPTSAQQAGDSRPLRGLVFNGAQYYSSTEAAVVQTFRDNQPNTVFLVFSCPVTSGGPAVLSATKAGSTRPYRLFLRYTVNYGFEAVDDNGGVDQFKLGAVANLVPRVLEYLDAGNAIELCTEGTSQVNTMYLGGIHTVDTVTLGAAVCNTINSPLIGNVFEILAFNRLLSHKERNAVRSYLATKWAIASVNLELTRTIATVPSTPCAAHFDATDAANFDTQPGVSVWREVTGNDYHGTQPNGANQPIRGISSVFPGLNTVAFNGGKIIIGPGELATKVANGTHSFSVWAVASWSLTAQAAVWGFGNTTTQSYITLRGQATGILTYERNGSAAPPSVPFVTNQKLLLRCDFRNGKGILFVNGTLESASDVVGWAQNATQNAAGLGFIPYQSSVNSAFWGELAAVLFFIDIPNKAEAAALESSLKSKWALVYTDSLARQINELIQSVPVVEIFHDRATLTTGAVTEWLGRANGLKFTNTLAAERPLWTAADADFNGLPSMTFDGVGNQLLGTGRLATMKPAATQRCYIMVFRQITWPGPNAMLLSGSDANSHCVYQPGGYVSPTVGMWNDTRTVSSTGAPLNQTKFGLFSFTGTTQDRLIVGGTDVSGNSTGANGGANLYIGSRGGGAFCNYKLSLLIITEGVPTELAALKTLLANAYGNAIHT